jgi:hypothetical protein
VGTEYHWYIVAHQIVKKVDANTYEVGSVRVHDPSSSPTRVD